jgi:hypothetical protein
MSGPRFIRDYDEEVITWIVCASVVAVLIVATWLLFDFVGIN